MPKHNGHLTRNSANPGSVFVGRALHWIHLRHLLIYHLDDANCEWISLPRAPPGLLARDAIWESKGCLNYCSIADDDVIGIWSLERGISGSERRKYSFSFSWKFEHRGILVPPPHASVKYQEEEEDDDEEEEEEEEEDFFQAVAFNDEFGIVYLLSQRKVASYNLATGETQVACGIPFHGSAVYPCWIAAPFLFLTQFDVAAMMQGSWRTV